jgi:hypothetical protein
LLVGVAERREQTVRLPTLEDEDHEICGQEDRVPFDAVLPRVEGRSKLDEVRRLL